MKIKGTYIFDSLGAEWFQRYFNSHIIQYGFVSVYDLFENPLLLGGFNNVDKKDLEEFSKIQYFYYGWQDIIPETKMFNVRKSKRGGKFEYVLKLPQAVILK